MESKIISVDCNGRKLFIGVRSDLKRKGKTIDVQTLTEIITENVYRVEVSDFMRADGNSSVAVDLGANIGVFSLSAIAKGAGRVIAVEPNKNNINLLVDNIYFNNFETRIEVAEVAVADNEKEIEMQELDRDSRLSEVANLESDKSKEVTSNEEAGKAFKAKAIMLEQLFKQYEIEECDVLKADIEWSEYPVFSTASKEVMRKIKYIVMEFHGTSQEIFGELVAMLTKTHTVNILGSFDKGGFIYARRF